jgi:hypothetical protein
MEPKLKIKIFFLICILVLCGFLVFMLSRKNIDNFEITEKSDQK